MGNYFTSSENKNTKQLAKNKNKKTNEKKTNYKKIYIPVEIRNDVWAKYCGISKKGKCYVCGDEVQRYNNGWNCSHVKAEVKNGATIVENLRVCCPTCNKSMGDQNLYQYIIDYDKKGDGHSNVKKYFRNNPDQLNDKRSNNFQKHKK